MTFIKISQIMSRISTLHLKRSQKTSDRSIILTLITAVQDNTIQIQTVGITSSLIGLATTETQVMLRRLILILKKERECYRITFQIKLSRQSWISIVRGPRLNSRGECKRSTNMNQLKIVEGLQNHI